MRAAPSPSHTEAIAGHGLRVAFLGPAGTFTEEALVSSAPPGTTRAPQPSIHDAVMAVQAGEADRAVVPIENSLEGSVSATLDTLAVDAPDVRITAEVVRPIRHCLIARTRLAIGQVERVISHPQATAQCAGFLRRRLPTAERAAATSTAEAVRTVAATDAPWGALGSVLSAELYGCQVLAAGVEDRSDNLTRFVWLARAGQADVPTQAPARPHKTSIVFWGFDDGSPGALVGVLGELAERGINMTNIESRPRRVRLGRYMFFADLEGDEHDPPVAEALRALAGRVEVLRVLGSYPAARLAG